MVKSVLSSIHVPDLQKEIAKHGHQHHQHELDRDGAVLQYHLSLSYPISKSTLSLTGVHLRVTTTSTNNANANNTAAAASRGKHQQQQAEGGEAAAAAAASAISFLSSLVLFVKAKVKGPSSEREYVLAVIPFVSPTSPLHNNSNQNPHSIVMDNIFAKLDLRVQMERIHLIFEVRENPQWRPTGAARYNNNNKKRQRDEEEQQQQHQAPTSTNNHIGVDISVLGSISSLI